MSKHSLEDFQKTANSILLAYAFLKATIMVSRLSCLHITPQTSKPSSMLSVILGGGLYNGFAVHSASPHSLVSIKKRTKYKKDKTGKK
jgi:hypothetical protein